MRRKETTTLLEKRTAPKKGEEREWEEEEIRQGNDGSANGQMKQTTPAEGEE